MPAIQGSGLEGCPLYYQTTVVCSIHDKSKILYTLTRVVTHDIKDARLAMYV